MKAKLVKIRWEDSRQPISEWQFLSDFKSSGSVVCESVGWLIHDDKKIKALAQNIGDLKSKSPQASGIIQIPASCIKSIKTLY